MSLDDVREQIDKIDHEIVTHLNQRVKLASEVVHFKEKSGLPIYMPDREDEVLHKLMRINKGPLSDDNIRRIYREIISAMIALERKLVVAYLGPKGTFTESAARKNFGNSLDYQPLNNIGDVFTAVERGDADYGVIPIENSTGGAVIHSMDRLVETNLKIVAQVYLPIVHCLYSQHKLDDIKAVYSKDQALFQCREWLRRNLPNARQVDCESTSEAVIAAQNKNGVAAIAAEIASDYYPVPIISRGIQDRNDNETRFLVIGNQVNEIPRSAKRDRSSIVFSIHDKAGELERVLQPFSKRKINLTKIESRPSHKKAWEYLFFIDFEGHWNDPQIKECIDEIKQLCPWVKWLGSYPNSH